MNPVFLDTVGLLAVWDSSDQWHEAAARAFDELKVDRRDVVSTTYVLAECGNAAARRPYRLAVDNLREQLEAGEMLIAPTVDDWESAWARYRRGEADQAGLVDHLSFSVARRLGITQVFTNDNHFRAAGFQVLF